MPEPIEKRARFDLVRYANCWEDAEVLTAALVPSEGRRMLSIASAGDNSFALLASGAEVVAADLSAAQLALVELKAAAIRALGLEDALAFLGLRPSAERRATLAALAPDLSPAARAYWRERPEAIAAGVVHQGKFEDYFRLFRTRVLPLVHRRRTVLRLLEERDRAGREAFYESVWNTWRWRLVFRLFFSRFVMGRLGRDPEFFRYVEGSVAERILARCRYALVELPANENPYLEYILTGGFARTRPLYLRPEVYPAVRRHLDRLTLHHGPVDEAARRHRGRGFDGFNLSDVFEYLDADTAADLYCRLAESAREGARFAYWNLLVPRRRPDDLASRVRPLEALARELHARDQAFFYNAFVVEEVGA